MVEYLPVGSQEAPQTIIAKKKISSPEILNYTPSLLCIDILYKALQSTAKVYQRNWRRKVIFRVNTFAKTSTLEVQQYCPAPNTVAFVYPIHRFQFPLFLFSLWGSFIKPSSLILFSFACRHCPRANPELLLHLLQRGVLALS